jgi:hypothetical protein
VKIESIVPKKKFPEELRQYASLILVLIAVGGAILTFGSAWNNLPEKVETQRKEIIRVRSEVLTMVNEINIKRTEDREILVRIDERLKRMEKNMP